MLDNLIGDFFVILVSLWENYHYFKRPLRHLPNDA